MVLEKVGNALKRTTDKIANAVFLDKTLVDGIVRELQRALIEADVNVSLVMDISKKIRQGALDERIKGIEKKEHVIKILHDELLRILGKKRELVLGKREVWLFVGLYGAGKTTTIGKLAAYYAKRGRKVCAIGLDVHRPAASEQLKQVCDNAKVECFISPNDKNALKIWKNFEDKLKKYDLVLVDTAGRDALDDFLIDEIKKIFKTVNATETFLVLQADIGQTAKRQAEVFRDSAGVSGVIITRMDSTAKAGGALTACAKVGAPVVFIGTGEKTIDLEMFEPESFLSRLLGMGDLKSLMERVRSVMSEKEIERQQAKLAEGKFTLRDLQTQLESMGQLGSMDKLMGMIPGLGKIKDKISEKDMDSQAEKLKRWKNCINSMTEAEIENPEILEKQTSRIKRIALGSGCSTTDVRMLIKQWKMLNEMIKSQGNFGDGMDQKAIIKLARKFGKKMRF